MFNLLKKNHYYSSNEIALIEDFIVQQCGEYKEVFHEIVSPDIHLDIAIIPPTEENNYYQLVTMGMGAHKMKIPKEYKSFGLERAELLIKLPPTWNIKSDKEEDYWPIRLLKTIARLPIQSSTWISYGHTVSANADNTPVADNTKFCGAGIIFATNTKGERMRLNINSHEKINFYELFPLYREEIEYTFDNSFNDLLELMESENDIVNIRRKNYGI